MASNYPLARDLSSGALVGGSACVLGGPQDSLKPTPTGIASRAWI
ncbi:MAG TPA: hypothetical protein VHV75_00060 [Solirubrobacteraceae bacterium]|jgi:hypothetical protein|nr:hypothetical protein [Solirubrobacteraceae bacterium]